MAMLTKKPMVETQNFLLLGSRERMKYLIFLLFLSLNACLVYDFDDDEHVVYHHNYDEYCYELHGEYPLDCWLERPNQECCVWETYPHCIEVQCSFLDHHGYSYCEWDRISLQC